MTFHVKSVQSLSRSCASNCSFFLFRPEFPVEVSDPKGDDSLPMAAVCQAEDRGGFSVTKLIY